MGITTPSKSLIKVLYLDLSATCRNDLKTGIERVARALAIALIETPPPGYRVEPVYLDKRDGAWGYFHARRYMAGMLGIASDILVDERADPVHGDIVLGLDISGGLLAQAADEGFYDALRADGVQTYFMVYDLLPLLLPHAFPPGADAGHARWLSAVAEADGAVCITQAVADDLQAWSSRHIERNGRPFHIVVAHLGADIDSSAPTKGLPEDANRVLSECRARPTFLMVGTIEPRKGHLLALEAFTRLWRNGININLVIVGKEGWLGLPEEMRRTIPHTIQCLRSHPERERRLFWLEGISDEYLEKVYAASTCLIAASEGEGFGLPLIEAAQHGLPIIARDIPVFREIVGENAHYFPQGAAPAALGGSVVAWLELYRQGAHPKSGNIAWLTWSECARNMISGLLKAGSRRTRIYIDISVVYKNDFRTGIQRVVRGLLAALLDNPDDFFEIVPVYLDSEDSVWCYKVANISLHNDGLFAEPEKASREIDAAPGDILLCLDLAGGYVVPASRQGLYSDIKKHGVTVYFVVYDLLPVRLPEYFAEADTAGYLDWLGVTAESDGVLCISQAVAADYRRWFGMLPSIMKSKTFQLAFFHLGADITSSSPSRGLPEGWEENLNAMSRRPCFLSVGTIEPRKGYRQVLSAFETLWKAGSDLNLVMVGKSGWMMSDFCERLSTHPELGQRLWWLDGISDEYLEKIYAASDCLIAASEGEGFGLPLIEAAQHGLPIIARDIPVFREIAGRHAYYFSGSAAEDLARALADWLRLYKEGRHPCSANMPWLTWAESAEQLKRGLLDFQLGAAKI